MLTRRRFLAGTATAALTLPLGIPQANAVLAIAAAGYVGLQLLSGATQYAGGQLMASALGEVKLTDVRSWIEAAVAELEAYFSAELKRQLDQHDVTDMKAWLEATYWDLNRYAQLSESVQKQNRDTLHECLTRTEYLYSKSMNYDAAFFVSMTAVAYRLFTVNALYELDRDPVYIRGARGGS